MDKPRSHAPIVAVVLLLLPVLYVGSYLALVVPKGTAVALAIPGSPGEYVARFTHYQYGHNYASRFYWPLERFDRNLRPGAWPDPITIDE